jgi:hypothetical protein
MTFPMTPPAGGVIRSRIPAGAEAAMTPDEWLVTADPLAMLDVLLPQHGSGSMADQSRKLRLYFCALARLVWPMLPGPHRATVETAEQFADGGTECGPLIASVRELARRMHRCDGDPEDLDEWRRGLCECGLTLSEPSRPPRWTREQWRNYTILVGLPLEPFEPNFRWIPRSIHRADLIRDAFLPPGFLVTFNPAWRTPPAVALARSMYRSRDFAAMAALADILEESGCDHGPILDHCRNPFALHARGCWVVDELLAGDPEGVSSVTRNAS